jgi:flagellar hook-associated protein 2
MGISSVGLGSGLDVKSIVSQLVALEKQPLTNLQTKATGIQTKISAFSQVKSLVSTLSDAAGKLSRDSAWSGLTLSSSNASAVTATVSGIAAASTFSVGVQQLAQTQSTASKVVAANTDLSGTLSIELGSWTTTPNSIPPNPLAFAADTAKTSVSITIGSGDSLSDVAAKINDSNAGVSATVLRDASGERLMIRSKDTGDLAGFRITAGGGATAGLSALAFDPANGTTDTKMTQVAQNAKATLNGVEVSSKTNTLTDAIPGLSLQLTQVTTTDATVTASTDIAGMKKNIQDFVDAYNAVNTYLSDSTKYDDQTKEAGLLQGDATAVGLQNSLRRLMGSSAIGTTMTRLADVGISMARGGNLTIGTVTAAQKAQGMMDLDSALKDPDSVKKLFAGNNNDDQTNGLALKIKNFTTGLLSLDGMMNSKADALDASLDRNADEQEKVNKRATSLETRLNKQYSALDAQMASLTALSNYVNQQVTLWNKSTG